MIFSPLFLLLVKPRCRGGLKLVDQHPFDFVRGLKWRGCLPVEQLVFHAALDHLNPCPSALAITIKATAALPASDFDRLVKAAPMIDDIAAVKFGFSDCDFKIFSHFLFLSCFAFGPETTPAPD
jgi:hypothetical protein